MTSGRRFALGRSTRRRRFGLLQRNMHVFARQETDLKKSICQFMSACWTNTTWSLVVICVTTHIFQNPLMTVYILIHTKDP